jgi:phytoene/squalene synthetase
MTTFDARAGLYVPLRLFAQEIAKGRVLVTYDLPSATMMQFGVPAIDDVARSLDDKVQRLLAETVARASSTPKEQR